MTCDAGAFRMSPMYYWRSLLLSWQDPIAALIMKPGSGSFNNIRLIKKLGGLSVSSSYALGWGFPYFHPFNVLLKYRNVNFIFISVCCQELWQLAAVIASGPFSNLFSFSFFAAAKTNLASSLCLWVPWVRTRKLNTGSFSASTWRTLQTSSLSHLTFATGVRNPINDTISNEKVCVFKAAVCSF